MIFMYETKLSFSLQFYLAVTNFQLVCSRINYVFSSSSVILSELLIQLLGHTELFCIGLLRHYALVLSLTIDHSRHRRPPCDHSQLL